MSDTYQSTRPFDADTHLPAVAIYCSDGRFAGACEQFLAQHLDLARCDRVVVPGGPGALAGHTDAALNAEAVIDDIRFLVEAHRVGRLVLIAHASCGFYLGRLNVSEGDLPTQQRSDLATVAKRLRDATGIQQIDAYRAEIDGDRVRFTPVSV